MILTFDFGSSATKVALWDPNADAGTEPLPEPSAAAGSAARGGLVAMASAPVDTVHPAPDRSEQDPTDWWTSLVAASGEVRARAPERFAAVDVIGCTGARQTVVAVDGRGRPTGRAILWSDRRAGAEADRLLATVEGGGPVPSATGIRVDGSSVAAKLLWLRASVARRRESPAWILSPRDLVVWWLTGEVATDPTMASRSGLYHPDGAVDPVLAGASVDLLAPVVPSDRVTGQLNGAAARDLGLAVGTPVVIGAGDRACEVLGAGATDVAPMVSWGTTANLSVPVTSAPSEVPAGTVLSRSATGDWLLEGGLSAAGSLIAWLARLTGQSPETLSGWAGMIPPGSRGVVATPWLEGARAPWWREAATVGWFGIGPDHGPADLARAAFEAVAWEVQRCLEAVARRQPPGPAPAGLALGGSGAAVEVWIDVLSGITGLSARPRRSGQAASAGAALLAARALGIGCQLDRLDPPGACRVPAPGAVAAYRDLRSGSDRVVAASLGLTGVVAGRSDRADREGTDADRTDRDGTDADRTDRDGTDADRTDRDGTDADRTDRDGTGGPEGTGRPDGDGTTGEPPCG